ncbi:hypothetical protein GE09DRAFT_1219150 [Coniochaeta sp. 2T2.1]|nr:hypothetical protein GE09DRAFT_1219150 [Coniochaeta sp. 2T2.1]
MLRPSQYDVPQQVASTLHNIPQHTPSHPLIIYLPPFFQSSQASPPPLPSFLSSYPTAVINYRWHDPSSSSSTTAPSSSPSPTHQWPTPLHDTLFAYHHLLTRLSSPSTTTPTTPRPIYIYSSYLGASIAASLALTESHVSSGKPMAVRGLVTYNGIYNWTMFLPDHPVHHQRSKTLLTAAARGEEEHAEGSFFHYLKDKLPDLFPNPGGMFDPFASPALFFRDPGMWVPEDFDSSVTGDAMSGAVDALSGEGEGKTQTTWNLKPPPKSYLTFPPWSSTLKIPEALLLYESTAPAPGKGTRKRKTTTTKTKTKRRVKVRNTFEGQAMELGVLMRRSVERYELRDGGEGTVEGNGEEGAEGQGGLEVEAEAEAERRVGMRDVGPVEGDGTLGGLGERMAGEWLRERVE